MPAEPRTPYEAKKAEPYFLLRKLRHRVSTSMKVKRITFGKCGSGVNNSIDVFKDLQLG